MAIVSSELYNKPATIVCMHKLIVWKEDETYYQLFIGIINNNNIFLYLNVFYLLTYAFSCAWALHNKYKIKC